MDWYFTLFLTNGSKQGMYNLPVNDVMMDGEEEIGAGVQVNFDQAKMYEAWCGNIESRF